jgi:hypothetical protein
LIFLLKNHEEGGSEQVRFRPQIQTEPLDMPVEQFFSTISTKGET